MHCIRYATQRWAALLMQLRHSVDPPAFTMFYDIEESVYKAQTPLYGLPIRLRFISDAVS